MPKYSGKAVYKLGLDLWFKSVVKHTASHTPTLGSAKATKFTQSFAHLGTFLCTFFTQYYDIFSSVIADFVHTIHIAYKQDNNLNEGII